MRCGDGWVDCTCDVVISERTFYDFMEDYASQAEDIYEDAMNFVAESCFDCQHQMTPQCPKLLDYIHDVVGEVAVDLSRFHKITKCEYFVPEYRYT